MLLNSSAREIIGHPTNNQGISLTNLFIKEVTDKTTKSAWGNYWTVFTSFGTTSAGIIGLIIILKRIMDIYATREKEGGSDECEVAHERSGGAKTWVRIILFLPCSILYFFSCMHRNGFFFCLKRGKKISFLGYTRKMSVRRFDSENFAPIVGFHNDFFPAFQPKKWPFLLMHENK